MIYLASPYSHVNPSIREARFRSVRLHTAIQLAAGRPLFSPIVYGHQFANDFKFPTDAASWEKFNLNMLLACESVEVLQLSGWRNSLGVSREIQFALYHDKPVYYVEPEA